MDIRFLPHNFHLEEPSLFAERDPHLRRLKELSLVYVSPLLDRFPRKIPGIYALTGARQIGKTTLLKQWMARLLHGKVAPKRIAYFSGELIDDHHSLVRLLSETMDQMPSKGLCYLLLDEVTYIKDWDKGVKYLADDGSLENYDHNNGLQSDRFSENTCVKLNDGKLIFGCMDGLLLVDPQNIKRVSYVPPVVFTNFQLFNKDVDYVVKAVEEGETRRSGAQAGRKAVMIVDQFTGRLMPGRRFSEGLHEALEAKESVEVQAESQTLATITLQNFFRLYNKLAGMTGTAETEAQEFFSTYKIDVIVIPTNRPVIRDDENDVIYRTRKEKYQALIDEAIKMHEDGRPVLIGTLRWGSACRSVAAAVVPAGRLLPGR